MSIQNQDEFDGMSRAGKVVGETLAVLRREVHAGMTTADVDAMAAELLRRRGARPAPAMFVGFPAAICVSVNEEAVHGLPGSRRLREGDLVKLDVAAEVDGYVADAAITVALPPVAPQQQQLCEAADAALARGMNVARPRTSVCEVGRAVEKEVRGRGFRILRELGGHGVGRKMWEPPHVPNFHDPRNRAKLSDGLVVTIEPILSASSSRCVLSPDGWTVLSGDLSLCAHVEHTIVIRKGEPLVLTAV
jgi:methionyl aminopeptidase